MPDYRCAKSMELTPERFRELMYFCFQYGEWIEKLKSGPEKDAIIEGMPRSSGTGDPTGEVAIWMAELTKKCDLIERTAMEAGGENYMAVLKGVTVRGSNYAWLKAKGYAFCGKRQYYQARRRFYWLLDKKKKWY